MFFRLKVKAKQVRSFFLKKLKIQSYKSEFKFRPRSDPLETPFLGKFECKNVPKKVAKESWQQFLCNSKAKTSDIFDYNSNNFNFYLKSRFFLLI